MGRRRSVWSSTLDVPVYSLFCGIALVATTTEDFGRISGHTPGGPRRTGKPWPSLTGLAVESVETLVPTPARRQHTDLPTRRCASRA